MLKSVEQGTNDKVFQKILTWYVKPPALILDCTCGEKIFWRNWGNQTLEGNYVVIFSDIRKLGDVMASYYNLPFQRKFDCVVFDPPYFKLWGYDANMIDGGPLYKRNPYALSKSYVFKPEDLDLVKGQFYQVLRPNGKLIMKLQDVRSENIWWQHEVIKRLGGLFNLLDVIIYVRPKGSEYAISTLIQQNKRSNPSHAYFFILESKAKIS